LDDAHAAARATTLQIQALKASTSSEIDAAFANLDRVDALFVGPDGFFNTRRVQLALLTMRHAIPATYAAREYADAGGLMSYGTSLGDMYRQVGVLYRPHLKRREACRSPGDPINQIRACHQPADRKAPRPLGAADAACPRRRGDRITD